MFKSLHNPLLKTRHLCRFFNVGSVKFQKEIPNRISISNVSNQTTLQDIMSHFKPFGAMKYVTVEQRHGKASVIYKRKWSLEWAIDELNNSELQGNVLELTTDISNLRSSSSRSRGIEIRYDKDNVFASHLISGQLLVKHFQQFGAIVAHKSISKGDCYILYKSKEGAAAARSNTTSPNSYVAEHNVNGLKVRVGMDYWQVPEKQLFFLTSHQLKHPAIKCYFSSFGEVRDVRKVSLYKKHAGYTVLFTGPEPVTAALKDKHEINGVEFSAYRQDTRHSIDLQFRSEQSLIVGPVYSKLVDAGELKQLLVDKYGNLHKFYEVPFGKSKKSQFFRVIFGNPESTQKLLKDGLFIGDYRVGVHRASGEVPYYQWHGKKVQQKELAGDDPNDLFSAL